MNLFIPIRIKYTNSTFIYELMNAAKAYWLALLGLRLYFFFGQKMIFN